MNVSLLHCFVEKSTRSYWASGNLWAESHE